MLYFASLIRQSMAVCRRTQPIPQDFEHALKESFVSVDDLSCFLTPPASIKPVQMLLPSPTPEDESDFTIIPLLDSHLSGERDRSSSLHIPKHFPEFPSKHTYRHTPVFTEREQDPQKIRERATEDGRHGEEALRRLARASFRNSQSTGVARREKRLWGRKSENMETMFEKTVKALAKQKSTSDAVAPTQLLDGMLKSDSVQKIAGPPTIELAPIVNCEREFWRKPASAARKTEKTVDIMDNI
jgi:Transcription factor TFIID complex subunit 8 C-term